MSVPTLCDAICAVIMKARYIYRNAYKLLSAKQ